MTVKAREELRITDDYVFGEVMRNERYCKELLEGVLDTPIDHIEIRHRQHDIRPNYSARGVRLDVYLQGSDGVAYDVEMQAATHAGFRRRLGYYRSILDVDAQDRGVDYENMKEVIVIFFTQFDPFGADCLRYDCTTMVEQTGEGLKDGSRIIVLNSKGAKGDVGPIVESFLAYMEDDKMQSSDLTREIDLEVNRLRANDDWYGDYMRYQLYVDEQVAIARNQAIREGHAEGLEQGLTEGRAQGLEQGLEQGKAAAEKLYAKLAQRLVELGRSDELPRALTDSEFRASLIEELALQ